MKKLHKIIAAITTAASIAIIPVISAFAASGVVNASLLNVRKGPGTDYEVVGQLSNGAGVEVLESRDGWYKIINGGTESYVDGRYITLAAEDANIAQYFDSYKYAKVTASVLNIREKANVYCNVVGKAGYGAYIEIIGKQNGFVIVLHNGKYAFMAENYIEYISFDEYKAAANKNVVAPASASSTGGQRAVDIAMKYIGVPYVYGGSSPSGFDCSGLTSYVYKQMGYSLNRTAAGQASNGTVVASKAELKPGDLVLFQSSGYSGIGHVGIYIGNGNMVHAPKPGYSVCVVSINSGYYAARYVGARRIV